jgi:hypothetical protein
VEHIWVIEAPAEPGELALTIEVSGLRPTITNETSVALRDDQGLTRYGYTGLAVWDQFHRSQTAWFEVTSTAIEIHIETDKTTVGPLTVDPLISGPTFLYGVAQTEFGSAVSIAEVNGDGLPDVLVGRPLHSAGQTNEGRAEVFYGIVGGGFAQAPFGLNSPSNFAFESNVANSYCGRSVAFADVDGNGLIDVIIGCSTDNASGLNSGRGGIRVHINTGSLSAPGFSATPTITFVDSSDVFPAKTMHIVAYNIDSIGGTELFATATSAGTSQLHMYRYSNGASPAQKVALPSAGVFDLAAMEVDSNAQTKAIVVAKENVASIYRFIAGALVTTPQQIGSMIGQAVTQIAAGDLNADGISDIVMGNPISTQGTSVGVVSVHISDPFILQGNVWNQIVAINNGQNFGSAVAIADVNRDRYGDVLLCNRISASPNVNANCRLYGGSPSGINFTVDRLNSILVSPLIGDYGEIPQFANVVTAPNESNDGTLDLVMPNAANTSVEFYEFGPASLKATNDITPESNQASAGASSVAFGDVNNDSIDDLIIGTDGYNGDQGAVYVYFGGANADAIPDWCTTGTGIEKLGTAVAVAKVRGAGQAASLIVGAPNAGNVSVGRIAIWNGPLTANSCTLGGLVGTAPGAPNQSIFGVVAGGFFGSSIANATNAINNNGDGVVVGGPCGRGPCGSVSVFSSAGAAGLNGLPNIRVNGTDQGIACDGFGSSVANAGNVDTTNGRADILIGAQYCDSNGLTDNGKIFLLRSVAVAPFTTVATWRYTGIQTGERLHIVAGIGDINADGLPDIAVGAPDARYQPGTPQQVFAGRVAVFFGGTATLPPVPSVSFVGGAFNRRIGASIAGGKDINYDGRPDMVIGEPGTNGAFNGRALICFGSPIWDFNACAAQMPGISSEQLGSAVAMGDFRNDKYADIAATGPSYSNGQANEGRVVVRTGEW